jgi:hypothetical protein
VESKGPARPIRTLCDCGALLLASGLGSATGGYPGTTACPLACPLCRGLLSWDGGCERCHGCTSGRREDWTFPGDRYELDTAHWQRVDGPRRACTPEQNAAGFAAVRAILQAGDARRAESSGHGLPPVDPAIRAELARRAARQG